MVRSTKQSRWANLNCPAGPTQTKGRIQRIDPPILDTNTSMVWFQNPKVDLLFGSAQGSGKYTVLEVSGSKNHALRVQVLTYQVSTQNHQYDSVLWTLWDLAFTLLGIRNLTHWVPGYLDLLGWLPQRLRVAVSCKETAPEVNYKAALRTRKLA